MSEESRLTTTTDDVDSGSSTTYNNSSHLNDHAIAGPSSASEPTNSSTDENNQFESEEYMKLLKKMQDDFNKEFLQLDDIAKKPPSKINEKLPCILSVKSIKAIKVFPGIKPKVDTFPTSTSKVNQNFWTKKNHKRVELITETSKSDKNATKMEVIKYPVFQMEEFAPLCHKYFHDNFTLTNKKILMSVSKEHKLLENDLPPGIFVKTFENRLDLFSALIEGPTDTPYEGCLFMFDIQLHKEHPRRPPKVHYWSFCEDKLNPNLYTCGMVCLSLLGTWFGQSKTEQWTENSTIYQLLISIQSLILVQEPFFNEPGYHNLPHDSVSASLSGNYNSKTLLLVLQSIMKQIEKPPAMFRKQMLDYYRATGIATHQKLCSYLKCVGKFPLNLWNVLPKYEKGLENFDIALRKLNNS